jgi:hypothetical protein
MDFIERVLHLSPDGGSGVLEPLVILIPLLLSVQMIWLGSQFGRSGR